MKIGIIGAGFAGLTAAYELTKRGHKVILYEKDDVVGGLASGFKDERWEWTLERFYHHWFASDAGVIGLIAELGLKEHVVREEACCDGKWAVQASTKPLCLYARYGGLKLKF